MTESTIESENEKKIHDVTVRKYKDISAQPNDICKGDSMCSGNVILTSCLR
jgi:hypothetical protein